jgi:hypothetical protein
VTPHGESASNPYESPISEVTPENALRAVKKKLATAAWILVLLPPLAMLAAIGLGVYIDSLTLGPRGFFFVILLIAPGAWAVALACVAGLVAYLAPTSLVNKIMLWNFESALCVFVYYLVFPLVGGWS